MSAIAASNVTFALPAKGEVNESSKKVKIIAITFGNGTLTYPATGVPLSNLSLNGFPNVVESVDMFSPSPGDGFVYKYDLGHNSVRIYESPASAGLAALTELTTAATPAATTINARVVGY